jgi:hypothetical protein
MLMGFRRSNWKLMAGTILIATATNLPLTSRAQSPGDVIRIGNPGQWSQFESYWNQLINLSAPKTPPDSADSSSGTPATATATDPQILERNLIRNLRVSDLRLQPILKLNGSSNLMGRITNRNSKPVTVTSVNVEIFNADGVMVQTAAAVPQPATIPAGSTVTFTQELLTIPADSGYRVRLSRVSPFSIQGGI